MKIEKCTEEMELAKETLKEKDHLSFATKNSCVWQTLGFKKEREDSVIRYAEHGMEWNERYILVWKMPRTQ